ncbi:hypothetical protein NIES4075_61720 [Tolypothrix sp. NIES-4075]|nr:hypothetical protein NIES4075_61720 [Tolypothrix sp. NIES-4075]
MAIAVWKYCALILLLVYDRLGNGEWGMGNEKKRITTFLITDYRLPITNYQLPITYTVAIYDDNLRK